ncbi:MAG: DUF3108 domain-containing protein [Bacteroidales bacterium]|nr:DUF3108 domain-containing protein [Bacteroidales bacterium]
MTCIRVILILLCASLALQPARSQEKSVSGETFCIPVRTVEEEELVFQAGEKLTFTMHYEWGAINSDVGTGTVVLDTVRYNGIKAFHCSVYGRTTRLYDLFFKVREDFDAWFACDGLRPLKFTRDTHEGHYVAKNTYIYDWNAVEPHIDADVYSSSSGQRYLELPLTPCTYDLPSLFFLARNMDMDNLVPGKKYPMTFAIDDDVYNVYFILYGRETIKVKGLGTVKTIKFAARLLAGEVFTGEEDMMIWVTDDDNRIPVCFEAPILVGTASGRLKSCSGLKHPFTALIHK